MREVLLYAPTEAVGEQGRREWSHALHRGTSLIRPPPPLELYRKPVPRVLGKS